MHRVLYLLMRLMPSDEAVIPNTEVVMSRESRLSISYCRIWMVLTVLNCIATIVSSLAACISVALAYYNVKETNHHNITERERLSRQEWYQQLVLVNLVPEINDFVAESALLLEQ